MDIPEFGIIIFWLIAAFFTSKALVPPLLEFARDQTLFIDKTGSLQQKEFPPTIGGLVIFSAFLAIFSASSYLDEISGFGYLICALIILLISGVKDDVFAISAGRKLFTQFFTSTLIVIGAGIYLTSLGGIFGIGNIPAWGGVPLTILSLILLINAQNLIDFSDGLLGSIAILPAIVFGYWFYVAGLYQWAAFSFILVGTLAGFLWYNWSPARIFMGEAGVMVTGFCTAVIAIKFVEYSNTLPNVVSWQSAAPIVAGTVFVIPLYNSFRGMMIHRDKDESTFDYYHNISGYLIKLGFSHSQVVIYLVLVTIIILGNVILLSTMLSNTWLLVLVLTLSVVLLPTNKTKTKIINLLFSNKKWLNKESGLDKVETRRAYTKINSERIKLEKEKSGSRQFIAGISGIMNFGKNPPTKGHNNLIEALGKDLENLNVDHENAIIARIRDLSKEEKIKLRDQFLKKNKNILKNKF